MLHAYVCFPYHRTYNLCLFPIPPYRFKISWYPPLADDLGLWNPIFNVPRSLSRFYPAGCLTPISRYTDGGISRGWVAPIWYRQLTLSKILLELTLTGDGCQAVFSSLATAYPTQAWLFNFQKMSSSGERSPTSFSCFVEAT